MNILGRNESWKTYLTMSATALFVMGVNGKQPRCPSRVERMKVSQRRTCFAATVCRGLCVKLSGRNQTKGRHAAHSRVCPAQTRWRALWFSLESEWPPWRGGRHEGGACLIKLRTVVFRMCSHYKNDQAIPSWFVPVLFVHMYRTSVKWN